VGERLRRIGLACLLGRGWGQVQEVTHGFHRLGAIGAGEQAVVADAVETFGKDLAEEAADELANVERHGRVAARFLDLSPGDLRWRHGGCSATNRRAQSWDRRTGAWHRRTLRQAKSWKGGRV